LARLPARKKERRRTEEEKEIEGIGVIAASIVMAGKIYGVDGLLLKQTRIGDRFQCMDMPGRGLFQVQQQQQGLLCASVVT
jgi:hypothetical protein